MQKLNVPHLWGILGEEFYACFLSTWIRCESPRLWCNGSSSCIYPYLTVAVAMDSHAVECFIILLKTPTTWESLSLKTVYFITSHVINCIVFR